MANYLPSEIVDMIIIYGVANSNVREAARQYQNKYPNRRHPDYKRF